MDEYIGRVNELEMLESRWKSEEFEFGAIYGRRRVGKTSLVRKFMEGKKGIYFLATKDREYNLLKFSRAIGQALFGTPDIVPFTSFAAAFSVIENHVGNERIVVAIDEISYAYESDKTILSVLQSFIDQGFRNTRIFLILCGSNMSFIENNVLGIKSPVYGRRTFQIKLHPFLLKETSQMLPAWSLEDVAASHVITGGIPYYLTFIRQHSSLKEAVKAEFFSPGGRLYTEGRLHLMMELRSLELYDLLLVILASGVNEVSKIADKSAKDMSIISQALQKLANL